MNNYKIKVNDEVESKEAQELFFKLGYTWLSGCTTTSNVNSPYLYTSEDGGLWCGDYHSTFNECGKKELTLPQLRDLVAQSKAKSIEFLEPQDDGTYKLINWTCMSCPPENFIEVPDEAELYVYWPHDKDYHFQSGQGFYEDGGWNLCSFSVEEIKKGEAGAEILWSREPIQEQGLISGAEAYELIGKRVEVEALCQQSDGSFKWEDAKHLPACDILNDGFDFRLKPRTIKLSLEIPAPFEPKVGETYYFITTSNSQGFDFTEFDDSDGDKLYMQLGAYKTVSDARKAVAALRGIKG